MQYFIVKIVQIMTIICRSCFAGSFRSASLQLLCSGQGARQLPAHDWVPTLCGPMMNTFFFGTDCCWNRNLLPRHVLNDGPSFLFKAHQVLYWLQESLSLFMEKFLIFPTKQFVDGGSSSLEPKNQLKHTDASYGTYDMWDYAFDWYQVV